MQGATPLAKAESTDEMSDLSPKAFEPTLLNLISGWVGPDPTPVIACGMVDAKQDWNETPYRAVPTTPLGLPVLVETKSAAIAVHIIPGLKQSNPADVMRGEETRIAGFLALNPGWDGVICMPGTHSKWVLVSAGEVVSFQTFMTGELFASLSQHTVLRHSIATTGWDETTFLEAVDDAMSKPERLAARLFSLRADDLLNGQPKPTARSRLSGQLIGAELAASRPYWLGQNIAIVGADKTAEIYASALARQGAPATIADATRMTLAGLTTAHRLMKGTT
ncbi:MAG: 2-dehydro-3-deoxygalactonokinase [Rhodobacteraceae bacterium]|nr:2-dehydro-3-deoxygalactonokinase [Paracoccaceae bacterium]